MNTTRILSALGASATPANIAKTQHLLTLGFTAQDIVNYSGNTLPQKRQVLEVQPVGPVRYDGDTWTEHDECDGQPGPNFHYFERLDADGEPTEDYTLAGQCPFGEVGDIIEHTSVSHEISAVYLEPNESGVWEWVADLKTANRSQP